MKLSLLFIPRKPCLVKALCVLLTFLLIGCENAVVNLEEDRRELKELSYNSNLKLIRLRKAIVSTSEELEKAFIQTPVSSKTVNQYIQTLSYQDGYLSKEIVGNVTSLYFPVGKNIEQNEKQMLWQTMIFDTLFPDFYSGIVNKSQLFYINKNGLVKCYPPVDVVVNFQTLPDFAGASAYFDEQSKVSWKWIFGNKDPLQGKGTKITILNPVEDSEGFRGTIGLSFSEKELLTEVIESKNRFQLLCDYDGRILAGNPDSYKVLGISQSATKDGGFVFRSKIESVREATKEIFFEGNNMSEFKNNGKYFAILASDIEEIEAKLIRIVKKQ